METVIETHDLCKSFGSKRAVDRLNLAVPRGAVCALLGDNGAGKTTTLRMLTGLLPPDSGSASVLGKDCWTAADALRRRVAFLPERPRYYDWMSVAEIGWFSAGFHVASFHPRFQDWIGRFHLDAGSRLGTLSKGEYAKVGLALALAADPEVLILDEPTSGLDLLVRHEFLASMVRLAAEGRTVLLSSHQVAEVERVASHAVFLSHGRLLLAGSLDELRRRVVRFRLRFEGQPPAAGLGIVLQQTVDGKRWEAVLLDPADGAAEKLAHTEGIHDVEATTMHLEEIYCALLARKEVTP